MRLVYSLASTTSFLFFFLVSFVAPSFSGTPVQTYDELLAAIRAAHGPTENRIKSAVEPAKFREAWETGQFIQEHLLLNKTQAEGYSEQTLQSLAKDLGTTDSELSYKLQFARAFPAFPAAYNLGWPHYREAVFISDAAGRDAILKQAEAGNWSAKKLHKEIKKHKLKNVLEKHFVFDEIKPGKLGLYKIVLINGELKAELGFDVYRDAPPKGLTELAENQIISSMGKYFDVHPEAKPEDLYTYNAVLLNVFDGNSFDALVDLGFNTTVVKRLRLRRVISPELAEDFGEQAKAELDRVFSKGGGKLTFRIARGYEMDRYGRYLVDVFVNDRSIDQELLDTTLFTVRS